MIQRIDRKSDPHLIVHTVYDAGLIENLESTVRIFDFETEIRKDIDLALSMVRSLPNVLFEGRRLRSKKGKLLVPKSLINCLKSYGLISGLVDCDSILTLEATYVECDGKQWDCDIVPIEIKDADLSLLRKYE